MSPPSVHLFYFPTKGGSIGDVYVTWEIEKDKSTAEPGADFKADGAQLFFPFGATERSTTRIDIFSSVRLSVLHGVFSFLFLRRVNFRRAFFFFKRVFYFFSSNIWGCVIEDHSKMVA